ncbi:MAG: tetratricopeptide repeat protein, partial [Methanococcaceae archaeon]
GYEYDIFISYRQKDNKGDRWVSEFVDSLMTELESTFKEEISVYFDINPHDGLLETHDVDASLKDKLKCLVFIPIISRTYCDPRSFAWEHEFKAFVEQASNDQYGLKVKLPGGNVANRILPVQIHDLGNNDKKLIEAELGGVIRGIEFIYREPGVNKPLTPDDNEKNNLNNSKYKIQVNKVALAIKEIIEGLKREPITYVKENVQQNKSYGEVYKEENVRGIWETVRLNKLRFLAGILIIAIIIVVVVIGYSKIFKKDSSPLSGKTRNTIAVLPLKIIGDASEVNDFANGLVESLVYMLTKVGNSQQSFSVIPTSEITGNISASDARKRLGASMIISGSIQMNKELTRVILNLIDTKEQRLLQSEKVDFHKDKNLILQDEIISMMVKMLGIQMESQDQKLISAGGPRSAEANEFYLRGRGILRNFQSIDDLNSAIELFNRAVENDTLFALAYSGLAETYWSKYNVTKEINLANAALINSEKAISLSDKDAFVYIPLGIIYAGKGEFDVALKAFQRAIELDPQNEQAYIQIGWLYQNQGKFDKAEIYFKNAIALKPDYWRCYSYLGLSYYYKGQYNEAISQIQSGLQLAPANQILLNALAGNYWQLQRLADAIQTFEQILQINPNNTRVMSNLGTTCFYKGNFDKAIYYYKQVLEVNPEDYIVQGWLADAYFWSKDKNRAIETYKIAIKLAKKNSEFDPVAITWIAYDFGMLGIVDSALYYLNKANLPKNPDLTVTDRALDVAEIYLAIGEKRTAIEWIESAVKRGYGWIQIKYHPMYKDLIKDPGFRKMIEKYKDPVE